MKTVAHAVIFTIPLYLCTKLSTKLAGQLSVPSVMRNEISRLSIVTLSSVETAPFCFFLATQTAYCIAIAVATIAQRRRGDSIWMKVYSAGGNGVILGLPLLLAA